MCPSFLYSHSIFGLLPEFRDEIQLILRLIHGRLPRWKSLREFGEYENGMLLCLPLSHDLRWQSARAFASGLERVADTIFRIAESRRIDALHFSSSQKPHLYLTGIKVFAQTWNLGTRILLFKSVGPYLHRPILI